MLTRELAGLFNKNDDVARKVENELIDRINVAYEKAVKAAIEKFKALEKTEGKEVDREAVRKILDKTMAAFKDEFVGIAEPIQVATFDAYKDGLKETRDALTMLSRHPVNPK